VFDELRTDLAFGIRTLLKAPLVAAVLVATPPRRPSDASKESEPAVSLPARW
jgi:hypothetical protein